VVEFSVYSIFDHFDKVAIRLVKFFLYYSQTDIFEYHQKFFVCGYATLLFKSCSQGGSVGYRCWQLKLHLTKQKDPLWELPSMESSPKMIVLHYLYKNLHKSVFHLRIWLKWVPLCECDWIHEFDHLGHNIPPLIIVGLAKL
jgi:hypothetical protein